MKPIEYDKNNSVEPDLSLTYKEIQGLRLPMQVFYPQSSSDAKNIAVVCIHGGGWNDAVTENGDWNGGWMVHQAKYYAMQGFIGVAISYRSLKLAGVDISELYEDCRDAVRYLKNKFKSLEKVIVMGDSAGGHLASCLGIDEDDEVRPDIVVALNPVLNCTIEKWKYCSQDEGVRIALSPVKAELKKCADFLIMHGDADKTVEIDDSLEFDRKLKAAGKNSEMIVLPNVKHAFILYNYRSSDAEVLSYMRMIDEYLEKKLII